MVLDPTQPRAETGPRAAAATFLSMVALPDPILALDDAQVGQRHKAKAVIEGVAPSRALGCRQRWYGKSN